MSGTTSTIRESLVGRKAVVEPVFGTDAFVREVTALELSTGLAGVDETDEMRQGAVLVCLSVCDQDGNRVFGDDEVEEVLKMPVSRLKPLVQAASKVNGIIDDDEAKKN
jgi:hypothetical protein